MLVRMAENSFFFSLVTLSSSSSSLPFVTEYHVGKNVVVVELAIMVIIIE